MEGPRDKDSSELKSLEEDISSIVAEIEPENLKDSVCESRVHWHAPSKLEKIYLQIDPLNVKESHRCAGKDMFGCKC
jgi:hypothetical protein